MASQSLKSFALDLNQGFVRGKEVGDDFGNARIEACCNWTDSCCNYSDNTCRSYSNPPECPGRWSSQAEANGTPSELSGAFQSAIRKIAQTSPAPL